MSNGWVERDRRPGTIDLRRRWEAEERRANQTLYALLALNVAVFALWNLGPPMLRLFLRENFLVSTEAVAHLRMWTLLTSAFSHVDSRHLLFNLIALWGFGRDVAKGYGWRDLLVLYLGGAVAAGVGHVLYQLVTGDPTAALGASGAVMALAMVYAASFPDRQIQVLFVLPLTAPFAAALFVVIDVLGLFGAGDGTIAHAAHLGGAAFGLLWWRIRHR